LAPWVSTEVAALKPVCKMDGTGDRMKASGVNDGAAALVLMSEQKANELGIRPWAKLQGSTPSV
jgi:acetyl-CoA C-acetyltransferase